MGYFSLSTQCWQCWFYNTLSSGILVLFRERGKIGLNLAWNLYWLLGLERQLWETPQWLPVWFHLWLCTNTYLNPDLAASWLSLRHWLSPLGPGLQPWVTLPMATTVIHTQYFPVSSIYHSFSSWKILSRAAAPQNTSPAKCFDLSLSAQNSGNFTKHLLMPTSFFY